MMHLSHAMPARAAGRLCATLTVKAAAKPTAPRRPRARKPADRRRLALDMERFIAERVTALRADAEAGRDADPEKTARAVGHYVRGLTLVRAYLVELDKEDQSRDEPGPPPRSLSELRDELRRHLERIRDEERSP